MAVCWRASFDRLLFTLLSLSTVLLSDWLIWLLRYSASASFFWAFCRNQDKKSRKPRRAHWVHSPLMSTALASFEVEILLSAILRLGKLMGLINCHLSQALIAPIMSRAISAKCVSDSRILFSRVVRTPTFRNTYVLFSHFISSNQMKNARKNKVRKQLSVNRDLTHDWNQNVSNSTLNISMEFSFFFQFPYSW